MYNTPPPSLGRASEENQEIANHSRNTLEENTNATRAASNFTQTTQSQTQFSSAFSNAQGPLRLASFATTGTERPTSQPLSNAFQPIHHLPGTDPPFRATTSQQSNYGAQYAHQMAAQTGFYNQPLNNPDLMRMFIEDGRRRDALLERLVERLTTPVAQSNPNDANLNYNIMPDLTKQIDSFNGETDGSAAREWLECLTGMQRLHRWPDTFALEIARMQLTGGAKDWYRVHRHELLTWSQFRIAFQRTFVTTESHAVRWKKMVERVQRKDELSTTYFHSKVKLCKNLSLDDDETKEQILVGFWSKDLYISMAARSHRDLDELYRDIVNYSRVEDQRVDRIRGQRGTTTPAKSNPSNASSASHQSTTESSPPRKTETNDIKCYNCNQVGHFSRDCTEPRRELFCKTCNQKGHTPKHCAAQTPTGTPPITPQDVNQISASCAKSLNVYLKNITIGENTLVGLIDTGSAVCTIKAILVLSQNLAFNLAPKTLKSFGPNNFQVVSPGTVTIDITIDGVTVKNVTTRVVPDDVQPFDMLIGRTFTTATGVELRQTNAEFLFSRSDPMPFSERDIAPTLSTPIQAAEPAETPGLSLQFIEVTNGDQRYESPIANYSEKSREIEKMGRKKGNSKNPTSTKEKKVDERQTIAKKQMSTGGTLRKESRAKRTAQKKPIHKTVLAKQYHSPLGRKK